MSTSTISVDKPKPADRYQNVGNVAPIPSIAEPVKIESHFRDLMELTKPRISSMVLVTVALAVFVASGGQPSLWLMFHCLLGTTLVAASSGAFNQWLEQFSDAKMLRTRNRPLPSGRMTVSEVLFFGVATLIAGVCYLAFTVGMMPTVWAVATWIVYVCVYTPMKQRTSWNTTVGAISGAMPILIGSSAVEQTLSWQIIAMLCVMFFWQFPHFIAIAWLYRKEYAKAGLVMVTTTDESGRAAGRYSVLGACLLLGSSFLPLFAPMPSTVAFFYVAGCITLGIYQLRAAWRFHQTLDDISARGLLKASIIYLPLALGLIAVQIAL